MKKIYFLSILSFLSFQGIAQLDQTVETSYNVEGTYTDLGSNGSTISVSNNDDANSASQAIGFNFSYNNGTYTHFILNTNGFVKLGTGSNMAAPSDSVLAYTYFNQSTLGGVLNSLNAADNNVLCAFNHDLTGTSSTEYRYHTSGTTGNRVLTIQYKNVRDKNISDTTGLTPQVQFTTMSFQIKLYEANDMIEFVYGGFTPTSDTSLFKVAAVGIRGTGNDMILASKSSSHEWHIASFATGNYTGGGGFNWGNNNVVINKVIPTCVIRPIADRGRTLRFIPQSSSDAEIGTIYSNHSTVIPWGQPRNIRGRVTNVGSSTKTGTWVYCRVRGANTYNDSTIFNSLGVGATSVANFRNYEPSNVGIDTVTLSLSSDNEDANNQISWIQKVDRNNQGYSDSTGALSNFGWSAGSGIFAAKYEVDGKRRISKVHVKIGFNTASVGQSIYGVVANTSNTILGRSRNYVIRCEDMGKWVELEIFGGDNTNFDKPPPVITNAEFYVGMAIPGSGHFPMALQQELENRTGAYYFKGGTGSTGTFTDLSTNAGLRNFRICVNAGLNGTSLKLEPVTSLNDPSCAVSNQTVDVTVTNQDSIAVDFSIDTLHLEVSSTGAITQSHSRLINTGILLPDSSVTFNITNNFDLSVAGQYDVVVEARQWMEVDTANNYRTLTINVVDTPDVELVAIPDSIVCFGDTFYFQANPYTAGSISYQWKVNGANQGGPTSVNTFAPQIDWGDTVQVDLITDHCTTGTFTIPSNEIVMQVNPKPKSINNISDRDTVIEFTKKSYSTGILPGHTYLWKVSGGKITTDSTGAAVQVEWDGPNTNASVSVTETDAGGCVRENILPVTVISIVGIDENARIGVGEAYPNPANDVVNIPVYAQQKDMIQLDLYELSGRKVVEIYKGYIEGDQLFTLPVSDLNEGMYMIRLNTSSGYEKVMRLSIQR